MSCLQQTYRVGANALSCLQNQARSVVHHCGHSHSDGLLWRVGHPPERWL